MLIKRIDGSTRQLGAPADWDGKDMSCGVLPILDVQTAEGNFMFSAWEPTPPELEALNKGANILLGVRGTAHPVVSLQVAADAEVKHPDDVAVDQFAEVMKAKLADARAKGRSGWQECAPTELSYMLREHVEKGDPRDVANFCMFLWSLGKPIGDTVLPISGHAAPSPPQETFQSRVKPWMLTCFGEAISNDLQERNHRFFEEATELVQSTGMTQSDAHQLVDYVFGRPVGEPTQEVGGVMVTLAALCLAAKMDMHAAGETELARIWTKVEQIRAKQAAKPKHSPLPIAQPSPAVAQPVACHQCGLPMSENPHPDAGKPDRLLEVNTQNVCIPCLTLSRHQWAERAIKAERDAKRYQHLRACGEKFDQMPVLDARGNIDAEALDDALDDVISRAALCQPAEEGDKA